MTTITRFLSPASYHSWPTHRLCSSGLAARFLLPATSSVHGSALCLLARSSSQTSTRYKDLCPCVLALYTHIYMHIELSRTGWQVQQLVRLYCVCSYSLWSLGRGKRTRFPGSFTVNIRWRKITFHSCGWSRFWFFFYRSSGSVDWVLRKAAERLASSLRWVG